MAEKKFDLNSIIAEYGDNDFGFTAIDEEEYNSVIAEKEETVEEYKARLHEVERLILPFLTCTAKFFASGNAFFALMNLLIKSSLTSMLTWYVGSALMVGTAGITDVSANIKVNLVDPSEIFIA